MTIKGLRQASEGREAARVSLTRGASRGQPPVLVLGRGPGLSVRNGRFHVTACLLGRLAPTDGFSGLSGRPKVGRS